MYNPWLSAGHGWPPVYNPMSTALTYQQQQQLLQHQQQIQQHQLQHQQQLLQQMNPHLNVSATTQAIAGQVPAQVQSILQQFQQRQQQQTQQPAQAKPQQQKPQQQSAQHQQSLVQHQQQLQQSLVEQQHHQPQAQQQLQPQKQLQQQDSPTPLEEQLPEWVSELEPAQRQSVEQLCKEQREFDVQFERWRTDFDGWRQSNVGHPDSASFDHYSNVWEDWQAKMAERRKVMAELRQKKMDELYNGLQEKKRLAQKRELEADLLKQRQQLLQEQQQRLEKQAQQLQSHLEQQPQQPKEVIDIDIDERLDKSATDKSATDSENNNHQAGVNKGDVVTSNYEAGPKMSDEQVSKTAEMFMFLQKQNELMNVIGNVSHNDDDDLKIVHEQYNFTGAKPFNLDDIFNQMKSIKPDPAATPMKTKEEILSKILPKPDLISSMIETNPMPAEVNNYNYQQQQYQQHYEQQQKPQQLHQQGNRNDIYSQQHALGSTFNYESSDYRNFEQNRWDPTASQRQSGDYQANYQQQQAKTTPQKGQYSAQTIDYNHRITTSEEANGSFNSYGRRSDYTQHKNHQAQEPSAYHQPIDTIVTRNHSQQQTSEDRYSKRQQEKASTSAASRSTEDRFASYDRHSADRSSRSEKQESRYQRSSENRHQRPEDHYATKDHYPKDQFQRSDSSRYEGERYPRSEEDRYSKRETRIPKTATSTVEDQMPMHDFDYRFAGPGSSSIPGPSTSLPPHLLPEPSVYESDYQVSSSYGASSSRSRPESFDYRDIRYFTEPPSGIVQIDDLLLPPSRQFRPRSVAIILRGLPGSGKTHLAKLIKDKEIELGASTPRILSIDDYFMVEQEDHHHHRRSGTSSSSSSKRHSGFVYEYDKKMEPTYLTSMFKTFKKTIDDGLFPFIIVDAVNELTKDFEDFVIYGQKNGFAVFVGETDSWDVNTCYKQNVHRRSMDDIRRIANTWEKTPKEFIRLDMRSLMQNSAIEEVDMDLMPSSSSKRKFDELASPRSTHSRSSHSRSPRRRSRSPRRESRERLKKPHKMTISRWEMMDDATEDKLDRLDAFKMKKKITIDEYLQLPDDYDRRRAGGKRRVRWKDIEERKEQIRRREVGFVVGQNWDHMMDPTHPYRSLTTTKYF